jgi:hypothetical protein
MNQHKEWKNDIDCGGNKSLFIVLVNKKGFLNLYFYNKETNNIDILFLKNEKLLQRLFNLEIIKKNTFYDMNNKQLIDNIFSYKNSFDISNFNLVVKEYNIDTSLPLKDFFINSTDKKEKLSVLFGESIINNVMSGSEISTNDKNIIKYSICCPRKGFSNFINISADAYFSSNIDDDSFNIVKIYL